MPLLLILAAATATVEPVRCSWDEQPIVECRMADAPLPDGRHRLVFTGGGKRIVFEGRGANGWWSGTLNGAPAMGQERNRGNTRFATTDLGHRFAWWYPSDEHGTY